MSNAKSFNGEATGFGANIAEAIANPKSLIKESDFDDFPQIDVIKLIKLINEVSQKKKTAKEAAKEFGAPFAAFAKVFTVNKIKELLEIEDDQDDINSKKASNVTTDSKSKKSFNVGGKSSTTNASAQSVKSASNAKAANATSTAKTVKATSKPHHSEAAERSEIQGLMEGTVKKLINEAAVRAGMEDLTKTDFDEKLIACTMSTASLVKQYMHREISVQTFVEKLGDGEIKSITNEVLRASGMDVQLAEKLGVQDLSEIGGMASSTVAFMALTAAYEMVREAQEDLEVAKAHRIEIEAACNESIVLIRQYRQEMEYVVNNYLTERIETFNSGFKAMDKAILENDTNGYIKGNVEIQQILGYDVQFTNQEEFDDLMDSDIAFKL